MGALQNASDPNYDFYLSIIQDSTFWLALAISGFIVASVIVTVNSFLLFTIYKDPRRTLRSPPSFLIANLGVADLLFGLFTVFLVASRDVYRFNKVHMPYVTIFKAIMYTVLSATLFVSSYTMIAMSAACYVAINKPMDYKSIITKGRVKVFILILWIISLSACVLPATSISEKTYTMIYVHTHASLPAMLLTVIYVNVFRSLAKRKRELEVNGMVSAINNAYLIERERKMSVTIIIILTMFYVSYMPQYITLHLLHFCSTCQQSITFHKIDVVFSRFLFINSAVNPFIYAWKIPRYRRAFTDCIKILLRKPRQTIRDRSFSSRKAGQSLKEQSIKDVELTQYLGKMDKDHNNPFTDFTRI